MLEYLDLYFPFLVEKRSDVSKNEHLTDFERCLLAIMFVKTDRLEADLKLAWGVGSKVVTSALKLWVPRLGEAGRKWSRRLLSHDFVKSSQPPGFEERYGGPVAASKASVAVVTQLQLYTCSSSTTVQWVLLALSQ
jgi:hypothetical protein